MNTIFKAFRYLWFSKWSNLAVAILSLTFAWMMIEEDAPLIKITIELGVCFVMLFIFTVKYLTGDEGYRPCKVKGCKEQEDDVSSYQGDAPYCRRHRIAFQLLQEKQSNE